MLIETYIDKVTTVVLPKKNECVQMLIGLCCVNTPSPEEIKGYFNGSPLNATRVTFNLLEGCNSAFHLVLDYKLEYYNPCINMMYDINRMLYNGVGYNRDKAIVFDVVRNVQDNTSIIRDLTNSGDIEYMGRALAESMKYKMFDRYHYTTMILYAEAVLLFNLSCFWDLSASTVAEMKNLIIEARKYNNAEPLVNNFVSNIIKLGSAD